MINKNFLLIVFSVLILFSSVDHVLATDTSVTVSFSDGSLAKNLTINQTLKINGTVKDASGVNNVPSGDVVVYWWHSATQTWNLLNGSLSNSKCVYSSQDGRFNFDLNLKSNFLPKGTSYLKVVFENSTTAFNSSQSRNLTLTLFSNVSIYVIQPNNAKVGILQNYTVIVVDEDGLTPVSGINVTYTNIHGNKVIASTNASGEAIFPITLEKTVQQLLFTTPEMKVINTYYWFLSASNKFTPYPVAKGDVNLSVAIDSDYGYLVGEKVIISWNITGPLNLTNKYLLIAMYDSGKLQNSYSVLASDGQSYYTWKMSHNSLEIIVLYPEDFDYSGARATVSTFIDENNNSRTTKINVTGLSGLMVGKVGTFIINVFDYKGLPVSGGKVVLKFDYYDPFEVEVSGGVAIFTHAYQISGVNRNLTITYLGSGSNKQSSINLQVNVAKGTGLLSVNIIPDMSVVGIQSTVTVLVKDLVIPENKKIYAYVDFIENGKLQNRISGIVTSTGLNTGILELVYTFIKPHPQLTILTWMDETKDYNLVNGQKETIVNSGI
jgi:hypothetical protein